VTEGNTEVLLETKTLPTRCKIGVNSYSKKFRKIDRHSNRRSQGCD